MLKKAKPGMKQSKPEINITSVAEILRALANEKTWRGTISQLSAAMEEHEATCPLSPARLAMWLRQHEPILWWNHSISIQFKRTGRRRTIQLSQNDSNVVERRRHQGIHSGAMQQ
jgi:hypothetical protein